MSPRYLSDLCRKFYALPSALGVKFLLTLGTMPTLPYEIEHTNARPPIMAVFSSHHATLLQKIRKGAYRLLLTEAQVFVSPIPLQVPA